MNVDIVIPTIPEREDMLKVLTYSLPPVSNVFIMGDMLLSLSQKRNVGFKKSTADYIMFADDDNVIGFGAIEAALKEMEQRDIGILGFVGFYHDNKKIVCDGGSFRNVLTTFTEDLFVNKTHRYLQSQTKLEPYEVSEVANVFIVKREVFEKIGLFDSDNFKMELDEADFCYRARKAGFRVVMCPKAVTFHKSNTYSRLPNFRLKKNAYYVGRNRIIFQRKHNLPKMCLPMFVMAYLASMIITGKLKMILPFMRGVFHGCFDTIRDTKRHTV